MTEGHGNGFSEYKRLILDTAKRQDAALEKLNKRIEGILLDDLASIKTDVTLLKYKAGLWGSIAGSVAGSVATALVSFLIKLYFR